MTARAWLPLWALCGLAGLLWTPRPAAAQTMVFGPILGRGLTPDQMIVRWGTADAADGTTVYYRPRGTGTFQMAQGAAGQDHEIVLSGLRPGTTYEYAVRSGVTQSPTRTFTTCPEPGRPIEVVFYGDSRSNPDIHQQVVTMLSQRAPETVFESGDIVPVGTFDSYLQEFFPKAGELVASTPFMAAPGNHDALSFDLPNHYGRIFPAPRPAGAPWQPYYTFRCGNAQFVALDSNQPDSEDQTRFLLSVLNQTRLDPVIRHVLVWLHHAPYSPGGHGDTPLVRDTWTPIFNYPGSKVAVVFAGHDHIYARMNDGGPVTYVVSGGAGAELYPIGGPSQARTVVEASAYNYVRVRITPDAVIGTAFKIDGLSEQTIDQWTTARQDHSAGPIVVGPRPVPVPSAGGCSVSGSMAAGGSVMAGLSLALGLLLRRRRRAGGEPRAKSS